MICSCDSGISVLSLTPEGRYMRKCCGCGKVELLEYEGRWRRNVDSFVYETIIKEKEESHE